MEKLTIKEKIDRARDGRSQNWIVRKMREQGSTINEYTFSRKKHGYIDFTPQEIELIESILNIKL